MSKTAASGGDLFEGLDDAALGSGRRSSLLWGHAVIQEQHAIHAELLIVMKKISGKRTHEADVQRATDVAGARNSSDFSDCKEATNRSRTAWNRTG